jgi:DNA-3-methyladenine glycosylase I
MPEAPERIDVQSLSDYFEVMSKAVFQSGMSWQVVESKWRGTTEAFDGFDPLEVADYTEADVDRLAADTRIIRNRRKIVATIHNAGELLELDQEYRGFQNYLRSHDGYDSLEKDMRKRFKFLGKTGIYYFLYVVGEPVPSHHEWAAARGKGVPAGV